MSTNINQEMIKNSILFYKSRDFSEEEMVSDISEVMHISKEEVRIVLKEMKK